MPLLPHERGVLHEGASTQPLDSPDKTVGSRQGAGRSVFRARLAPTRLSGAYAMQMIASARAPDGARHEDLVYARATLPSNWTTPEGPSFRHSMVKQARDEFYSHPAVECYEATECVELFSDIVPRIVRVLDAPHTVLVCLGAPGRQRDLDKSLRDACASHVGAVFPDGADEHDIWHGTALSAALAQARATATTVASDEVLRKALTEQSGCYLVHAEEGASQGQAEGVAIIVLKRTSSGHFRVAAGGLPDVTQVAIQLCEGVAWWGPRAFAGHAHSHRVSPRSTFAPGVKLDRALHAPQPHMLAEDVVHAETPALLERPRLPDEVCKQHALAFFEWQLVHDTRVPMSAQEFAMDAHATRASLPVLAMVACSLVKHRGCAEELLSIVLNSALPTTGEDFMSQLRTRAPDEMLVAFAALKRLGVLGQKGPFWFAAQGGCACAREAIRVASLRKERVLWNGVTKPVNVADTLSDMAALTKSFIDACEKQAREKFEKGLGSV